ncbi:MAG: hypothetical protein JSV49_11965 [Thermoplasmata archaeon]|nr:MAG: hypothetical protein JSV49_11965 [Thermoplasmata archaeon]
MIKDDGRRDEVRGDYKLLFINEIRKKRRENPFFSLFSNCVKRKAIEEL